MKHIIGAFGIMMTVVLNIFACTAVINVSAAIAEAKEFKTDVIAEIENSNFNQNVIDGCIRQAQANGYVLQVTKCTYDARQDTTTAEIVLTYTYEIPLLDIEERRITRGIAR